MIAALYIQPGGTYFGLPGVDSWDETRDARLYDGPHPVVAHPPCSRWCRLAGLVEARHGYKRGDDGGCFAAALRSVRQWGGVLEHPAWTAAWPAFGLVQPPRSGWAQTLTGEWVCEVAQSAYGHPAQKLTWLLYAGAAPPAPLIWEKPKGEKVVGHMSRRGDGTVWRRNADRISKKAAAATPIQFRDVLIEIARGARARKGAA